jgi:uncharacterized protein YecE (DUF72 family)
MLEPDRQHDRQRDAVVPIRVGVAGFDYKDWYGTVYPLKPRGFDPLRYLAAFVDVLEINSSFYGPPLETTSTKWMQRIDDVRDFRFTAKLWRRFTHERKEPWTRAEADQVRAGFGPMMEAGRLDAVLLQFPWSFKNVEASREWVADVAHEFRELPLVIEVRHESWNDPSFYRWLNDVGIGFTNIDQPLFSRSIKPSGRATSHHGYIRVHGRNYMDWFRKNAGRDARYNYLYKPADLKKWVERTEAVAEQPTTSDVAVIFNNHYRGQAVTNALQFKSIGLGEKVPAPAMLVETYPKELKKYAFPV